MNPYKQALKDLERKYQGRIKRGKALARDAEMVVLSEADAEKMVESQIADLRSWTFEDLIAEFVDPEELLVREVLKRL